MAGRSVVRLAEPKVGVWAGKRAEKRVAPWAAQRADELDCRWVGRTAVQSVVRSGSHWVESWAAGSVALRVGNSVGEKVAQSADLSDLHSAALLAPWKAERWAVPLDWRLADHSAGRWAYWKVGQLEGPRAAPLVAQREARTAVRWAAT